MRLFSKIKGYFVSSIFSLGRLTYSAGQTFFATKAASDYIFKSTTASATKLILPVLAMAGGAGVNLIIRVPSIFKKFTVETDNTSNEELIEPPQLGYLATFFNYLFQASGHLTALFNALNAHFGTVVLSESIADLLKSDAHDEVWKEALVQSVAVFVAITALATYYSYDYQIVQQNSRKLAQKIDQRAVDFDGNTAKTLAASTLNLLAAPVLAKFWTAPSIVKIPGAEKLLTKAGITALTWTAGITAFINGITTLPSTYDYFYKNQISDYVDTALTKTIRYALYASAAIDSIASGLCCYIGIVDTAKSFDLNPYGYIITFAAPTGMSAAVQNAMLIRPGYIDIAQALSPKSAETQPLLSDKAKSDDALAENSTIVIPIDTAQIMAAITQAGSENEILNSDTRTEITPAVPRALRENYFRENSTVDFMFNRAQRTDDRITENIYQAEPIKICVK